LIDAPAVGRGFGKLILCGEHAVVYGHPAIAMAVERGTTVALEPIAGPTVAVGIEDVRVDRALRAVLPAQGLRARMFTDLPLGRGMGSSAAFAVALIRAVAAREGREARFEEVFERALEIERLFHGNPSGIDHAVSARGGAWWFRRGPPLEMRPVPPPPVPIVVLDTGSRGETAAQLAAVAARRPAIDPLLDRIGALADSVAGVLSDPRALGEAFDANHALLQQIGVSTLELDELAAFARRNGAFGAKLSGAGGGGVLIAVVEDAEELVRAAKRRGIQAFACRSATHSAAHDGCGQAPSGPGFSPSSTRSPT
jgi:mevalonate kinase